MKILVTGGAGFIGSNLLERLHEYGFHDLVVFDNETTGSRHHLVEIPHTFISGDIRDASAVDFAMDGIEAVVHLAADTGVVQSVRSPLQNLEINVLGTLNVFEAMRKHGVRRLVNASTGGAIIGEVEPPVHEQMIPAPSSPYGASKLAVEGYCSAYSASYGLSMVSLRFSNVYGPRSFLKGSVVAAFIKSLLKSEPQVVFGDGSQTRDFVHVRDLTDGIVAAVRADVCGPIQLGSGYPTSLNQLLEIIGSTSGRRLTVEYKEFRPGEVRQTYCQITRARDLLGYAPKVGLREGISETWDWFVRNKGQLVHS